MLRLDAATLDEAIYIKSSTISCNRVNLKRFYNYLNTWSFMLLFLFIKKNMMSFNIAYNIYVSWAR